MASLPSPLGTHPQAIPTNIPAGYIPVWVADYGWAMTQIRDLALGEGGQSAYIQDVMRGAITPNSLADVAQQIQDALLYQQLKIIPPAPFSDAAQESQAIYAGLAALHAAHASVAQMANYLMQLFGYDLAIAQATAQSVADTGTVFGAALPAIPPTGFDFSQPNLGIPS